MLSREFRRLIRATLLASHLLLGTLLALAVLLLPSLRRRVPALAAGWLRRAADIIGLKVRVHGHPAAGPCLLLANHISWLDILVLASAGDACFIAKAEVNRWPLLGWLAEVGGTEFVFRGSHASLRRLHGRMLKRLKAGEVLTVFPEGTSGAAVRPRRFRPRLLRAAVEAGASVQPVALYYGAAPELLRRVAFVGDDSLVSHLWALLGGEPVLAEVSFLPPLSSVSGDIRLLSDEAWRAVTHPLAKLELFELETRYESTGDFQTQLTRPA